MKKQVSAFIRTLGATAAYSGKSKIMYIKGVDADDYTVEQQKVFQKFGYGLPFKIETDVL
jgi:hypothetical protein